MYEISTIIVYVLEIVNFTGKYLGFLESYLGGGYDDNFQRPDSGYHQHQHQPFYHHKYHHPHQQQQYPPHQHHHHYPNHHQQQQYFPQQHHHQVYRNTNRGGYNNFQYQRAGHHGYGSEMIFLFQPSF